MKYVNLNFCFSFFPYILKIEETLHAYGFKAYRAIYISFCQNTTKIQMFN